MRQVYGVMMAVLVTAQIIFPASALARAAGGDEVAVPQSRFRLSDSTFANAAAQSSTLPRPSSPGGSVLRHALIGAAIGAALTGVLAAGLSDCGSCSGETAKAALSGAMYGALIGAAITIRPSWHSLRRSHAKIVRRVARLRYPDDVRGSIRDRPRSLIGGRKMVDQEGEEEEAQPVGEGRDAQRAMNGGMVRSCR